VVIKKKPLIPNVDEILRKPLKIKPPSVAKRRTEVRMNQERELNILFKNFSTITLGDYISAASTYNRELFDIKGLTSQQSAAYYQMLAFEERALRLSKHLKEVN
jgi:hypothetical protein